MGSNPTVTATMKAPLTLGRIGMRGHHRVLIEVSGNAPAAQVAAKVRAYLTEAKGAGPLLV